mgnify:CR=1 FL=1
MNFFIFWWPLNFCNRKEVFLRLWKWCPVMHNENEVFLRSWKWRPILLCSLVSVWASTYSDIMCPRKIISVVLLFLVVFCYFFRDILCDSIGKINKKVSCKVVPLKADVIFSGTVLEITKKQKFAKRRKRLRRRRKRGKGGNMYVFKINPNLQFCPAN